MSAFVVLFDLFYCLFVCSYVIFLALPPCQPFAFATPLFWCCGSGTAWTKTVHSDVYLTFCSLLFCAVHLDFLRRIMLYILLRTACENRCLTFCCVWLAVVCFTWNKQVFKRVCICFLAFFCDVNIPPACSLTRNFVLWNGVYYQLKVLRFGFSASAVISCSCSLIGCLSAWTTATYRSPLVCFLPSLCRDMCSHLLCFNYMCFTWNIRL